MYVQQHMKTPPITVQPGATIAEVRHLLAAHHFRHLPVVNELQVLLGMVTDRDIRSAYPSTVGGHAGHDSELALVNQTPVSEIMSTEVVSLTSCSTIDDALLLFDRQKVGALPVLNQERQVVGILSIRDLLQAYKGLFGLGEKGSALVAVQDDGQPRPLSRIVHALEEHEIQFSRVLRKKFNAAHGQIIYIGVNTFNLHAVHAVLTRAGLVVEPLNVAALSDSDHA